MNNRVFIARLLFRRLGGAELAKANFGCRQNNQMRNEYLYTLTIAIAVVMWYNRVKR